MDFLKIAKVFEKIENTNKRLKKVLILRDFLEEDINNIKIFDILGKNYQREIDKKKIGISIKTCFLVLSFLSKKQIFEIEKKFNQTGDIGEVAKQILKDKKQKSLTNNKLTLEKINLALEEISRTCGNKSNYKKKEILSNLYLLANSELEYKYLTKLLIDDFRIGALRGVLKEACVNYLFANVLDVHKVCQNCNYINLNLEKCFKCGNLIDKKNQKKIIQKNYQIIEIGICDNKIGLENFNIKSNFDLIEFAIRRDKKKYFLNSCNSREIYNSFLKIFEKKYNLINSFEKIIFEIKDDLTKVLDAKIVLNNPVLSMLAQNSKSIKEAFLTVKTPAILDYKYDGIRMQIHNNFGEVVLFSRNLENITNQFLEVVNFIKENFSDLSFVIDCECLGFDYKKQEFLDFQLFSKRIMRKDSNLNQEINVIVKAFDILYLNGETLIDKKYKIRRERLENIFLNRNFEQEINFDFDEFKKFLQIN